MTTLNQPKKPQNKTLRSAEKNQKHTISAKTFNKSGLQQIKKQNHKSK